MFPGLIAPGVIAACRGEMVRMLEEDRAFRKRQCIAGTDHSHDGHAYSLTPHMHTMLFPAFRSANIAALVESMLAHPLVAEMLRRIIGAEYRLRVDLVRMASGVNDSVGDFQLPHEWHRDSPGEFTFGIFFDDMSAPFSGGTAAINGGTHYLPYDPIWDFMFGEQTYTTKQNYLANKYVFVKPECRKIEVFNRMFKKQLSSQFEEIRGKAGDVYFFLNDTWHGRAPIKQGGRFMTMRVGGYPTDFPFKDDLPLPPGYDALPPRLKRRYGARQPQNTEHGLVIHRARKERGTLLSRLAHFEKKLAISCTERG